MRIVAYQTQLNDGKVLLSESSGESVHSNNLDQLYSFLLEPYGQCIKVCWNLDATVSAFLRVMGTSACRSLQETKRYRRHPFSIFYIPSKVFSVTHVSGLRANLYGLDQYYPDIDEPDVKDVQLLGVGLLKELDKMGMRPTKLTSPVAIYEECVLRKLSLPQVKDMPMGVAEMAWRCSGRLWIESHQLGYFK